MTGPEISLFGSKFDQERPDLESLKMKNLNSDMTVAVLKNKTMTVFSQKTFYSLLLYFRQCISLINLSINLSIMLLYI